jgi:hypothetical protein
MSIIRTTLLLVLTATLLSTSVASAQQAPACPMTPTIAVLADCVRHAADQFHITRPGVTRSHLAELQTAQVALDRGQQPVAIALLEVFIREVRVLSGKGIEPEHAAHMVEHARLVIQTLRG